MDSIDLSVIICTLNRSKLLGKCLESLKNQDHGQFCFETIVVDNGSTDDTKGVVESYRASNACLRYILESRPGLARARQTGFEASVGKYVAYLDDDAIAGSGWSSAICSTFERFAPSNGSGVAALGGPIEPMFETSRPPWLVGDLTAVYAVVDLGNELRPFPCDWCPLGANMALLRTALLKNPWNRTLVMCEEIELFGRLARLGFTFLYVPDMQVQHFVSAERLKPKWVVDRYLAEGVAEARLPLCFRRKARLAIAGIVKVIPLWALSVIGPAPQRLRHRCLARYYYGYLTGLLGFGDLWRMKYLSAKRKSSALEGSK